MKLTDPPGPMPLSSRRMRTGRAAGESVPNIIWHLGHLFTEHRRLMEIACGPAGCIDDAVDASHLFGVQPDCGSDLLRLETLVLGIQAQIHAVVGQGKIKLL